MRIITLDNKNIAGEHICCAISDKKGDNCVSSKKQWLKEAFKNGLTFKKCDVRGKAFIEYIPAEKAWCPIYAPNHLYINCFWVSGQHKGQGLSNLLLNECLAEASKLNKDGLVIISSAKKKPFLADPAYLKYKGFEVCDTAAPYFTLMRLSLKKAASAHFLPHAKEGLIKDSGVVLFYSNQCPFTEKYALLLEGNAKANGLPFKLIKFNSYNEAQKAPTPWTSYALFLYGRFITNEILTEKKIFKLLEKFDK